MAGTEKQYVTIVDGAGSEPKQIEWQSGDTRDTILERAGIQLSDSDTASVKGRKLRGASRIKAGSTIIIAGKPRNGAA